ncbi:cytochrome P450 [Pseudonocardia eucalypti]|uniref:Cytochrome P450 n=1 Tax=Pseudonocardia eucalypti TaxID=648755 RepID=A0ABP9PQM4_9PSEU|nr:cytochrome P450 [Pseudonocardia eucalypti]
MSTTLQPDGNYEGVPAYHYDNTAGGPVLSHHRRWEEFAATHGGFRSSIAQGYWVVTDGAAIQEALQDWQTFSSKSVTALDPEPRFLWIPEMLDPPLHTIWRRLLGREFSPKTVAAKEPEIRAVAVDMIERLRESGGADVLDRFARRFPTLIFLRLMGLPVEDLDTFLGWVHTILHLSYEQDQDRGRRLAAINDVSAYFDEQIAVRRKAPKDDLLSRVMAWKIDGEPIDDGDLHAFCVLMFMAGLDTVPISVGWALYHFASHPEHRGAILADPSLIPTSVEEILRVYSFVIPARKATRDVEIGGCPVRSGEMVMLPLTVTNRDPRRYDNPSRVDLGRRANNHIAFGSGPHRCLGSHLARLELNVAVEEWHRRIPDYRIAEGQELEQTGNMYGLKSLRLEW